MPEVAQPYLVRAARPASNEVRPWEISSLRPEPLPEVDLGALYQKALHEAETLVIDAKQAAQELRETTQRELEQERERVLAQAYAEGNEAGLAEGRAQTETERLAVLEPLQAMLTELPHAWEQFCLKQAPEMTNICIAAAERVLHEQLTLEPERILSIVRAAITHVPQARELTVVVHPDDVPLLKDRPLPGNASMTVEIRGDKSMWRGGCRVESRQGVVDASHDGALLRMADNLRGL